MRAGETASNLTPLGLGLADIRSNNDWAAVRDFSSLDARTLTKQNGCMEETIIACAGVILPNKKAHSPLKPVR